MITQTSALISLGAPLAGGGLLGFAAGFFLKKMLKLAIIAIGGIALLLGFLEYHRWITVNWVTVENQTQSFMTLSPQGLRRHTANGA